MKLRARTDFAAPASDRSSRSYVAYILICAACSILLFPGCKATTRYEVLCFLFDGVPAPRETLSDSVASLNTVNPSLKPQRRSSKHGPYWARMCDACHQKGSNTLVLRKEELCFKCHSFQPARLQHGPFAVGGCTVCHDPHQSGAEYLLVAEAKDFCIYCHDADEIYSHDEHRGSDTACTECHNPHASDNNFLLR